PLLNSSWISVALMSEKAIDPFDGGSPCADDPNNVCYREGIYQTTVYLPSTSYGYHIEYIRCCRNTMVNVPEEEGQTYYGYIPPTSSATNTSPYFTDVPVPFICVKDTVNLLNSATEPDGDSLVFSLAWPYAGGDKNFPMPEPPSNFVFPPHIQYNLGYNYLEPFGTDGFAKVDPLTGATRVYATQAGRYVIAIDVREYRDGKLINTTRRDIQILVNNCKPNPVPYRTAAGGTTATTFYVTAGEKLQLPLTYKDDNALTLIASGELVDNSGNISPKGQFTVTSANKTLSTVFSWQTKCKYVRSKPYVLNIRVRDNGCPSKFINHTYSIYVLPFKGADSIYGPSPACQGWPGEVYSVNKVAASSSLVWRAIGGTIVNRNGSAATIQWDDIPEGIVKAVEVSQYGCPGDTITRKIKIRARPAAAIISGTQTPCKKVVSRYEVNAMPGSTYKWFIEGGTNINSGASGKLDVLWAEGDSGKVKVIQRTADGCYSDTASLEVDIRGPIIDQIFGSLSVCPNSRSVDYWVVGRTGSVFYWSVDGGVQSGGGNSDHIKVDWGEKGGGWIRAVEITPEGCVSDTIKLFVQKDYVLITTPIAGDTSVCEYTDGEKYSVHFTNGSTYEWKIIGGTIVTGAGTAEITVNWDKEGTGFLTVTETAYDPINDKPCVGKPVDLRISIYPLPSTKGIFGPKEICENDTAIFTAIGMNRSIFIWTIDNDTLFKAANYNDTFIIVGSKTDFPNQISGSHVIRVQEMTKDSCFGDLLSFPLEIHPQPVTSAITGPGVVCQPNLSNHLYSVTGFSTSAFEWDIAGGVITSGGGTPNVVVDWLQPGIGELSVKEISVHGCVGETKRITVKIDSLFLEIDRVTTGRQNEKIIEIYWSAKNKKFMNGSIKLYRKRQGQGQFTLLDSLRAESGFYTDVNVATDQYTYSYYIEAINACGENVKSIPHRSILLKSRLVNDTTGTIYWTNYEGWPNGVDYHYVFRRLNDDSTLIFYNLNKLDSFLTVYRGLDGWNQCYRVEAVKAQDNSLVSWSNSVCFEFEPILWIPNAFTPGNLDQFNDQFRVFLYNYTSFEITIYNRWGERIFHSTDPNVSWDGTWKGVKSPQDVYIYLVNVRGFRSKIYKSGTLHLLR
ncbi:MAG: T9SS type B sorting domain-containing protein, partial [Bacteroidia bacterium]